MPSSSPEKARIHNKNPDPSGLVLVAAGGRVHFKNEDDKEYQVSIGREKRANQPVEFVLAEHGSVTIVDPMQNFIIRCLIKLTEWRMAMEADRLSLKRIWGR